MHFFLWFSIGTDIGLNHFPRVTLAKRWLLGGGGMSQLWFSTLVAGGFRCPCSCAGAWDRSPMPLTP